MPAASRLSDEVEGCHVLGQDKHWAEVLRLACSNGWSKRLPIADRDQSLWSSGMREEWKLKLQDREQQGLFMLFHTVGELPFLPRSSAVGTTRDHVSLALTELTRSRPISSEMGRSSEMLHGYRRALSLAQASRVETRTRMQLATS